MARKPPRTRLPASRTSSRLERRDLDHPLHRSRVPMGLLGDPRATRARVALRRSARLEARDGWPHRAGLAVRGAWLHAIARRARPAALPRSLWHAVLSGTEGSGQRHIAGVPR